MSPSRLRCRNQRRRSWCRTWGACVQQRPSRSSCHQPSYACNSRLLFDGVFFVVVLAVVVWWCSMCIVRWLTSLCLHCSGRLRQPSLVCCLWYGSFCLFVCLFVVVWWCAHLVVLAVIVLANHDTELGAALQRHLRVPVVEAVGRCHHVPLNIMEQHHGVLHFVLFIAGNVAIEMCSSMIICHIFTLFRIVPPHMRHPPLLAHGWGVKGSKKLYLRVKLVPKLSGWKYSGGDSGGGHKRLEDNWPKPELGREACILGSLPCLQQS